MSGPDGDALGCIIALALALRQLGKEVTLWNEDGVAEKYRYPAAVGKWSRVPPAEPVDVEVAIALDTASQQRLGTALAAVKSAKLWINIDHHVSNEGYGDLSYIDPTAPATGQILYELIASPASRSRRTSRRTFSWRSRRTPARSNIPTPLRARMRSARR